MLTVAARAGVATPAADSAPVRLATSVEPKAATIGTPLRYTLRIEADKGTELIVPELAGQIGEFQVTDFGSTAPREEQGRVVLERWYTLVTYTAGAATIAGPTVQYRVPGGELLSLAAPDAAVAVESLLDAPDAQRSDDVRDIKPPVAVPRDYTPLLWIAAAGLAVIGLGVLCYRLLRRRRRPVVVVPPRPAHEIALEALARLRDAHLLEDGFAAEFYVRLSGIVRGYLEGRFHLRAPEMTTEEFLQAAQRDPQLNPGQRGLLGQFLSEADLVKFARHVPAAQDAERAYGAAREFVESTAPAMEVPRAVA
ncbi:MAG: hypothetical protein ACRERC_03390 [Candidatus Binatia bacterium]